MRFILTSAQKWTGARAGFLGKLFLGVAALALPLGPACAKPAKALPVKKAAVVKLKSGAAEVTVEQFARARQGKCPAVIWLHDSASLQGPGPLFRVCAQIRGPVPYRSGPLA
jgi:hypothetical protein